MKGMHKLRQNEEYTDMTLQSGDILIQCHRNVLAAATNYFKAMFRCGLKESTSATVPLTMEPEILATIVDYMYTGEIELTVDNVESLFRAGDVLQLHTLKVACENVMLKQVEPANCVGFSKFATLYRLDKLQQKARRVIQSEFKTVALNAEFKELSCKELIEFIKDDDVNVEDEDVVFNAVLDWVRHDLDNRKSSFQTIIEHVRLPYCTSIYLRHINDTYDLFTPKCYEYLIEALSFQADTVHQHQMASCRTVPRNNFRMKSCLLLVGGLASLEGEDKQIEHKSCHYYKEDTISWESLTELPQSVGIYYSVCRVGSGLLLTGGLKGGAVNQCWHFDLATTKWEEMPPLITARWHHRSVSLDDCVYVVGGKDVNNTVLASVECLNAKRKQWLSLPEMPQAVYLPAVVTYKNKIFVFGGRGAQEKDLCCTQVFDTTLGQWSSLSDMPYTCFFSAAVTLNERIYVVGGHNRTCLKYDPVLDSWTQLSQPRLSHSNAPAVVWRGCILVAGGGGTNGESSVIEQFNSLTDTWLEWKTRLDVKLMCHCMFNVDLSGSV
ncbi:Kelch-like protein 21 [Lamellibrachia satsuma]|nr:Kelch-like protein 21 [Lamellibrachia satsuma]